MRVARSSALNRRITGWIAGVNDALGSGVMVTRLTLDQKTPGSTPGSPAIIRLDNGDPFEVRDGIATDASDVAEDAVMMRCE